MEPAKPPLPTCTNLPFQAAPSGIHNSRRMSLSAVGLAVTESLQTDLSPTFSETALVTSACGRAVFSMSAHAVSAWAAAGAARPAKVSANTDSPKVTGFIPAALPSRMFRRV
jgi:hypothetical protein